MADKTFYFLTFLTLLFALLVVFSKNPVYSVLYLILTIFCLSGHYLLLNAQFLFAVNIIVYAGAIMVLFLFVIMFLNLREDAEPQKSTASKLAAVVAGGMLLVVMVAALRRVDAGSYNPATYNSQIGLVENLGKVFLGTFCCRLNWLRSCS